MSAAPQELLLTQMCCNSQIAGCESGRISSLTVHDLKLRLNLKPKVLSTSPGLLHYPFRVNEASTALFHLLSPQRSYRGAVFRNRT
jgi:hypothetical protein